MTGTGGGSMGSAMNSGVLVDASASIGASGIGNTTITGQGGNTTGNSNYGVFVSNGNAMITASQGDINIMGQGLSLIHI